MQFTACPVNPWLFTFRSELVWNSVKSERKSAHPELEQIFNDNERNANQFYRSKYGIRNSGFLINPLDKQIVATVRMGGATSVAATNYTRYKHLTHYEP